MARGTLRIFLGAAAGAGTTYSMLREGQRLAAAGRDVVVGVADPHGRRETLQFLDGLDVVAPRLLQDAHGEHVPELDVDAALARQPDVAVVDEYAHVNAPGSRHGHRWQDIEELLSAGMDVLTTLAIQDVASLRDVVSAITEDPGGESVPDAVVRRADYIELVDISPELLRQRVADGQVVPRDRIDAALANEFRLRNLIALREIALIWLADRVDEDLAGYRKDQGITATWPARERVVVGLSGGPEGEVLIRRAARILSRVNGGDLLAVHVRHAEDSVSEQALEAQRRLIIELGGSCHTVSGEDPATSLLEFARGVNATQIVIGASPGRLRKRILGKTAGAKVVRDSGDIDVHIVSHPQVRRGLPGPGPALLSRRRTMAGFMLAVLLPVLVTAVLSLNPRLNLATHALVHLTGVMAVAVIGGLWPAVLAAVLGSLLLNYFETDPIGTFNISDAQNIFALLVFLAAAVAVSLVVGLSERRRREAARARAEAATLADLARGALLADDTIAAFLDRVRETFQVPAAGLYLRPGNGDEDWALQGFSGDTPPPSPDAATSAMDSVELADPRTALVLSGRTLTAGDRLLLAAHGAHLLLLREHHALQRKLQSTTKLAEGNNVRTAILRAVSHDLRTPLAGIKLAVTALRRQNRRLPEEVRGEMLATIESYTERLDALISNLLDMSRISSGSASPHSAPVTWRDVVEDALRGIPTERIRVDLAANMPAVDADPGMLERVIANVVENALKYAPGSDVVIVGVPGAANETNDGGMPLGELRIVDHGQGVPAAAAAAMFQPFQRLDDAPEGLGIGLGLAVAKGFTEAMGGQLVAEPTPGGGLTMVIRLPLSTGPRTPDLHRKAGTSTS